MPYFQQKEANKGQKSVQPARISEAKLRAGPANKGRFAQPEFCTMPASDQLKIVREFYWNASSKYQYGLKKRKRVRTLRSYKKSDQPSPRKDQVRRFSAEMGNLSNNTEHGGHPCIRRVVAPFQFLFGWLFTVVWGTIKWMVTTLLFIPRLMLEPFVAWMPCVNVADETRVTVVECIVTWLTVIGVCFYGFGYVMRFSCNLNPECITFRTETGAFLIAKSFGKAITASFTIGMIFVLKPVTEYIESLPFEDRWGVGWRKFHARFMNLALIFALGHFAAHIARQRKAVKNQTYEYIQLGTGLALFGLWFFAGAPIWFRGWVSKINFRDLCRPLSRTYECCFMTVRRSRVPVRYKGDVQVLYLREDMPFDDLKTQIKNPTLKSGLVYCSKNQTLTAFRNNEELFSAIHDASMPVIRLDVPKSDMKDLEAPSVESPRQYDDDKTVPNSDGSVNKRKTERPTRDAGSQKIEEEGKLEEIKMAELKHRGSVVDKPENNTRDEKEGMLRRGSSQPFVSSDNSAGKEDTKYLGSMDDRSLAAEDDVSENKDYNVVVSFDNQIKTFKLSGKTPWDDLVIAVKEAFLCDHDTSSLKAFRGIFFDLESRDEKKRRHKANEVSSNEKLCELLAKAKSPRVLITPIKRKKKRPLPFVSTGCPFWPAVEGDRGEVGYISRWFFRFSHIPIFATICVVYAFHGSEVFPLIALVLWVFSYRARKLKVEKILYKFSHKKNEHARWADPNYKYLLKLRIKLANRRVPDTFGYYVVLGRSTQFCSYTMVPAEGGTEIRLTIKHCTFIDSCLSNIALNENKVDPEEKERTGEIWFNMGRSFFSVYGPYMSSDYTIANAKRVAVMVQTTGSVVSDTVINFQKIRKYWDRVIVFAVGSDLMNYDCGEEHAVQSTTVFTHSDVSHFDPKKAKFRWMLNRIDKFIALKAQHGLDHHDQGMPTVHRMDTMSNDLKASQKDLIMHHPNETHWPNSVLFNGDPPVDTPLTHNPNEIPVIGLHRIENKLAEHILRRLQEFNYDVIVCSGAWNYHIHNVLERDRYNPDRRSNLERLNLHLELFGE
ncbi:hypothetical protein AAMO2058_000719600 [Amorphochlora amoebiformis]